jgi:hypothetical protein
MSDSDEPARAALGFAGRVSARATSSVVRVTSAIVTPPLGLLAKPGVEIVGEFTVVRHLSPVTTWRPALSSAEHRFQTRGENNVPLDAAAPATIAVRGFSIPASTRTQSARPKFQRTR